MKNKWMIAGMLALVLALFSGCMPKVVKPQEESSSESVVSDVKEESEKSENSKETGNGLAVFDSVEEYVKSDEMQKELDSLRESADGVDITVTAEGNKLMYVYTYEETMDKELIGPILDEQMEKQASTFRTIAKQIKLVVDTDEVKVQVLFKNPDGSVLSDSLFSSKDGE